MVQVIDPVLGYVWFVHEEPYRETHELVSNEPMRLEFQRRDDLTAAALAARLGWRRSKSDRRPDASRVLRALGMAPDSHRCTPREHAAYPTACALALALDMNPRDAGV